MYMWKVESKEFIENGKAISTIGLLAHNPIENRRRCRTVSGDGEDTMQ